MTKVVVTGTQREYENFVREKGWAPSEARRVSNMESAAGLLDFELHVSHHGLTEEARRAYEYLNGARNLK